MSTSEENTQSTAVSSTGRNDNEVAAQNSSVAADAEKMAETMTDKDNMSGETAPDKDAAEPSPPATEAPESAQPTPEAAAEPDTAEQTGPATGSDTTAAPAADAPPALTEEQITAISERTRERLARLAVAIEDGLLSEAQSLCDRSQNAIQKLGSANAQGDLEQQLAPLKAKLTELLDWKRFADTEKKKSLIEQMTAMIDSELNPPARAKKIKALQEEWRTLGHAEDNDRLWTEFSEAARKAFEPCKQHFRERKQLMRNNLTERLKICERLEAYADTLHEAQELNVSEVNRQENEAREQWKQYAPVAQAKIKQLQSRFNEALGRLRRVRRDALQENAQRKQKLIEEAGQLVAAEDLKQAINRAKAMQGEWKAIGPAPFRDERNYWQQFRAACDALFARLQREMPKPERGDNRKAPRARPANDKRGNQSTESGATSAANRRQQALLQEVATRAAFCQALESAVISGKPEPDSEELQAQWQALPEVSDNSLARQLQQRFEQCLRLQSEPEQMQKLAEDNADPARKLCIDMEIQAGMPSPEEDRALRMQQQLAQLQQDFGQGSLNARQRNEVVQQMKLQFLCLGPLADGLRAQLQPRVEELG